jgi:hypothetical protein
MNKFLIAVGVSLVVLGVLWPLIQKLNIGHLPGDIYIKKENFNFYFPLTTCIIISIAISIIFWIFRK